MDLERLEKLSLEGDEEATELLLREKLRRGLGEITVEYNGRYPNACSGKLTIKLEGREIYSKSMVCYRTGSVSFDEEWNAHIEEGTLYWEKEERDQFSKEIQEKVEDALSCVSVPCGGCI